MHGHPFLVAFHACCRICHVKVLPEVSFVIFVRAKNKDWLKAVYESCATSAFWGLSLWREGEDQIICAKCLMAAYYLCILWDCFESSMVLLSAHIDPHLFHLFVFSPLYCLVCGIAFFMFLPGGPGPGTASQTLWKFQVSLWGPVLHFTPKVPMKVSLVNKGDGSIAKIRIIYYSNM